MAIEKDVAREGKKSLWLIVLAVFGVCGGAYVAWGWFNRPVETPSQYSINRVANNAPVNTQETAQYRKLLKTANTQGAQQADTQGSSFVASLSVSEAKPVAITPVPEPVRLVTTPAPSNDAAQTGDGLSDKHREAMNAYLTTLSKRWQPAGLQVATRFGGQDAAGGEGDTGNAFSAWHDSLPGNAPVTPASLTRTVADATAPDAVIVPPNTRRPGVIDTAVNSDNLNSIVLAHIPAGKFAGASFQARGIQLAGDGVVIHFTRMTLNGVDYNVDAYGLQDDTLQSSVASEVNNRYVSRIVLPAIASSLGGLGALYRDENTEILSTDAGTISGKTGKVSGSAVAGTLIGGMGSNAGQVLASDAAKLPVKQVRVWQNQVVAIQFMKGVYASDRVNEQAGTTPVIKATRNAHP
ncbi:conjugal transfer protein TraO [Dryocola clanedunensis]|uniref:conjugal transfer protein TraO n=1 Tax=Cedecea sulfonylureivorans TaxID=3051154 RepID=UPI001925594F|nr:conjugal transfer protein TraO [Cedecea sulfonylureivorans]